LLSKIIGQDFELETCPVTRNRLNSLEKIVFELNGLIMNNGTTKYMLISDAS